MLESYITPILMSYVDKYIKNLKPSDLNLSLWGGDVSLTNLELNLHALEKELNLPITFLSGKIHELRIHVPWTKLYYEPAVITINTIECVLKLRESDFTSEDSEDVTDEKQEEHIKPSSSSSKLQAENENPLPPGYVQSLLNKVIYNLTVRVNNFILKYVEDDIVLSLNIKSAEIHSANSNWMKEFVDVAAPDWILHKLCNISDLTVCLDQRNASGMIEMYQDPLAYKCNLSCRMQVYYDKEGFHLPLEKNVNVYCECLELSITDQQLPLLLRLLNLTLGLYYGTLDLPGCDIAPHPAKDLLDTKGRSSSSGIMSGLGTGTFTPVNIPADNNSEQSGWLSWAMSMVPAMSDEQKIPTALLEPQISRFGFYISQAMLNFKITEPVTEGNFLGAQRFMFKPILTVEASGVAMEMITKEISFFDIQFGVTSLTGWMVDQCVCKNEEKPLKKHVETDDKNVPDPEEVLFLRLGAKDNQENKGVSFVKGSLFDSEFNSTELPEFVANAEEFIRKNSEIKVLSRFGAMFFEYLYTMNIEGGELDDYYKSTPLVKEESHQRLIVGPSMLEISSAVVHRMELVMKLAEGDSNSRKEKDQIYCDEFIAEQLLSGSVSHRHMHITVLDASLVILTADHSKSQPQRESLKQSDTSLSEILEEENEICANHSSVTTGCVFQMERLDLQRSMPMFPKELLKLIKDGKASKMLIQQAHGNMYAKVFGFQIGVSKHDLETENPMILNILPACNMSLFAKQGLVSRQDDELKDLEARFELPILSLSLTKPQWVLLRDVYESWMTSQNKVSFVDSSLVQDVFHPSAKQGGKIPVFIEAAVHEIKVQLHLTSESISSSGSVESIKAAVLSLTDGKTESTPVLYGPLFTTAIYNGDCFKKDGERPFLPPTNEPWFAFTLKVPLENEIKEFKANHRSTPTSGAVLLKCQGTVINVDPVLYTWLSYQPRMSSLNLSRTPSKIKQLKRTSSQSRLMSATTPRKKSYARGHVTSKPPAHPQSKQRKHGQRKEVKKRQYLRESSSQDFDGWVWKKLPLLASVVIQVDVESFTLLAPSKHLSYDIHLSPNGYDIPRNFIHHLSSGDSTSKHPTGLVVSLPTFRIRSANHQEMAVCQDILHHPLTLPPREKAETLPWVMTADNASMFTVWRNDPPVGKVEVYFILDPMCSRATLASARTSHPEAASSGGQNQHARLDFVVHTDFNPFTINCSKKQVDLLFQLYSVAVEFTSPSNQDSSFHDSDTSLGSRPVSVAPTASGRFLRRTASITSSSGFDVVEEDSISSGSTPKPVFVPPESPEVSQVFVRVSLWVQWTLPKLSLNVFGSSTFDGSDLRITTELEDLSASFDYQNGHFKAQCKVGNLSITHYQIGPSGQWISGPGGGTLLSRQDSLSNSLSKVHSADHEGISSDPGSHSFLYIDYAGSSVNFLSSKELSDHDELFEKSFRYRQEVHVTIQPFDIILWCPMLYATTTLFQRFALFQQSTSEAQEPMVSLQDTNTESVESVTNLPEVWIKLRGFRLVVPSCIYLTKEDASRTTQKHLGNPDLFALQASSLLVTSRPDNPISRLVVDKKLSKSLRSFTRSYRSVIEEASVGDVQYQLEVKGLRVWAGCWNQLCRTLPRQNTADVERDLFEQNPALEWNTYSAQDRTSILIIPMVSEFDIKSVVAPPVSLCISNKLHQWQKPIFGLSLEVNVSTSVECFLSKSQIQLMHSILAKNITNNDSPNQVTCNSKDNTIHGPASTTIHDPRGRPTDEKLDSGVASECSFRLEQKPSSKSPDLHTTSNAEAMECLITAGGLSVCFYDKESSEDDKEWFVPVFRVSLIQPAFAYSMLAESNTIQISCFDVSLTKSEAKSSNTEEARMIPSAEDFDVVWFQTGKGSPDKRTELPPAFVNFQCKIYPTSPADLKLDFGRPIWTDIDLDLVESLKCFTTNLWPEDNENSSAVFSSDNLDSVRSMALSTNYVACTLIAGSNQDSAPVVKTSFSSLNLGASFKAKHGEFSQRAAANLNFSSLTISTGVGSTLRSFLLPYDASVDVEIFRVSPPGSDEEPRESAVSEIVVWFDSGLLQVNFGQEHLRCINMFTDNILTFIDSHLQTEPAVDKADAPATPDSKSPIVHRSCDDLRTGPFRYITSAAADSRPSPYQILFTDDGLPTMTWRYPEPRSLSSIHITPVPFTTYTSYPSPVVMEEDSLLPCVLRYWDNLQKSYIEHATFYISENSSTDVELSDPTLSSLCDVVAASEWQVIANITMATDGSEASSDDGTSSMISEQSHVSPISSTSLAACMKVDSIYCSQFVPTLSVALDINLFQLTVFNHMENIHNAIKKSFKGFDLQHETPREQEFVRVTAEGTSMMVKTWPTDTPQLSFQLWTNVRGDVLDYRNLRWSSLLCPVDLSLTAIKDLKTQASDGEVDKLQQTTPRLSFNLDCGDILLDASQSRAHTLAAGITAWQGVESFVASHFIVCNNTNQSVRFGQTDTDENILLRSKEMAFYSWRSSKDGARQSLHICLDVEGEYRWCEPFGIDSPGAMNRAVHYGLHTATLVIEVKKKSGLQRQIILHGSHLVTNHTSHDIEVQLLQNPALNQIASPTLHVLHSLVVPSQSSAPSYVISHGGLAGIRVRLRGETTWSGTLPIEEQLPNYKQHFVVQMLGTKEFKNFFIWYNATLIDTFFGQMEISFSPLFIVRNHLPQTIQMAAVSANGDVSTTHEAPGQAAEYQVFDLPPDAWHYVTFKLGNIEIPSNPPVPLNTTLFELFEVKEKARSEKKSNEAQNLKWPYSSNQGKSSTTPYQKPVESTLVRHVQSCQNQEDEKSDRETKRNSSSSLELQCQIIQKWKKLRSIVLDIKPSSLVENKCNVTLYLEDDVTKNIFDILPGQVISPTKLQTFRIGVLPHWLKEVYWSDAVVLVDGDQPKPLNSGFNLEQCAQLQCSVALPSLYGTSVCSLLISSKIVHGIRIITVEETTRIVCMDLPRPLLLQPVIISDDTTKIKQSQLGMDSRIQLKPKNPPDIISFGITYWDMLPGRTDAATLTKESLNVLMFGLPGTNDSGNQSCSNIRWSRPVRIQEGIVRQCVSLEASFPGHPLPLVVITLIENGLIKVVVAEDRVPRILLTNNCANSFQFGQHPSSHDKQKAKTTRLSRGDLVVSENLEMYTKVPRLDPQASTYYEPPELQESFLTKKPQSMPMLRIQFLKQANIKDLRNTDADKMAGSMIDLPQGWSEPISISHVGVMTYNLPGNYRLHVDVTKKSSFLTHVIFRDTCAGGESSTESSRRCCETVVKCVISSMSVCLHDESVLVATTEVSRLNLEETSFVAQYGSNGKTRMELLLGGLQIDNQMENEFYHFPVIVVPLENESRNSKRKAKKTLKPLLSCHLDFTPNHNKIHVHLVSVALEPMSVFIEDTFIYRMVGMLDSFILPESERRPEDDDDFRAVTLASAVVNPVMIDRLDIEPLYVLVTFHASVKLFVSADHTPLYFGRFHMSSVFTDPSFLAQLLAAHYAYSALMKIGWVLGSLDIIGSPTSFIRSFGQGLIDFFYLPYDGLTRGPTAFVTGITSGMSSFMSHISAGALTSITNLASSISRNMDRLTFDEQYIQLQEEQRAAGEPRRVLSGFTHGCRGFLLSVLCAVAGVADQPMQELFRAESLRDVTSGVVTGVGKGLIGVVTKPLGGAMELVSQTGQGILQGTGLGDTPRRLYEPETRGTVIGNSSHLKYFWKLLESKPTFDNLLSVNVSVFVSGDPHFDAVLIISSDSVLLVDRDDDTILKAFSLKQVEMREDPQHPRALLLYHNSTCADTLSELSSATGLAPSNHITPEMLVRRNSRHSFAENESLVLTLFMDPVYLRPSLSRFRLFKGCL